MRWPADVPLRAAMPQRMPTWRAFWEAGRSGASRHGCQAARNAADFGVQNGLQVQFS